MNELTRRRASLGVLLFLFALLSIAMVTGGCAYHRHEARAIHAQRYRELRTIASLKIHQIVSWRNERLGDAQLTAVQPALRDLVAQWMLHPSSAPLEKKIRQNLTSIQDFHKYQNIMLLGLDGRILFSLDSRERVGETEIKALAEQVLRSGQPVIGDLFQCSGCSRVHLDAGAPILGPGEKPVALLLLRSDPENLLFPLVQSWPTSSETAETLLVRREGEYVVFLNRLRHSAAPALTLRLPMTRQEYPAVQAVNRMVGEFMGPDYRGIQVLTDLQAIPESPWFMVAKVDTDEILAEARYRGRVITGFTALGILAMGALLGFLFYFAQAKVYEALFRATRFENTEASAMETTRIRFVRSLARIAGFVSIAVGCLVLLGWALDSPTLKGLLPGFVTMKANTALGFILAGGALAWQTWPHTSRRGAWICAGALTLFGILNLVQYVFGVDFHIDQVLFTEPPGTLGTLSPGRMAPATALSFALFGVGLILATFRRMVALSQWLALPVGLIGSLPLLGYLYGPLGQYGIGYFLQLALHTAGTLIILSLGLLHLHPTEGFVRKFMTESMGGWLLRRIAPVLLAVAVLIGWVRVVGERHGWYENALGAAFIVTTFVIMMLAATWWAARSLDRIDSIRSQAETRLRESAEEIRATLYGIGDGVIATDSGGRVIHMNPVAERLTGWMEAEAVGLPLVDVFRIINEETRTEVENPAVRVLREGHVIGLANHTLLIAKDGTERAIADSGAPVFDDQGAIHRVVLVFRDQTEERLAQRALSQSELKFRRLHESLRDAYALVDMEGRIMEHNRVFQEMLGYSGEELRSLSYEDLTPPEWHELETRILQEEVLVSGYSRVYEKTYRRKDGSEFPVELRTNLLTGDQGEPLGMWAIIRDISERKRTELEIRRLNTDLEKRVQARTRDLEIANKELEAFAYSASHDLRAPLRHMDGFLSMLARHLGGSLDEKGTHFLDVAQRASVRMGLLVDGLLAFSRLGRTEIRSVTVDSAAMAHSVIEEFKAEWADRAIHWKVGNLPVLQGDPTLIRLVFQNLVGNALKFTRSRTEAVIEMEPIEGLTGETGLLIRDNGVGFDPTYGHKLFGVFQRLHREDEFEGTGIGLANVHRIVSRHGGRVWAEGRLGQGATFFIAFPVSGRKA